MKKLLLTFTFSLLIFFPNTSKADLTTILNVGAGIWGGFEEKPKLRLPKLFKKKESDNQTSNINDEVLKINLSYLASLDFNEKIKLSKSFYNSAKKNFKRKKIVRGCSELYYVTLLNAMDDNFFKKVKKKVNQYDCTRFDFAALTKKYNKTAKKTYLRELFLCGIWQANSVKIVADIEDPDRCIEIFFMKTNRDLYYRFHPYKNMIISNEQYLALKDPKKKLVKIKKKEKKQDDSDMYYIINKINKLIPGDFYFFAYSTNGEKFWGRTKAKNNRVQEGSATSSYGYTCSLISKQISKEKVIPANGAFELKCPNINASGSWKQDSVKAPGLGQGITDMGEIITAYFSFSQSGVVNFVKKYYDKKDIDIAKTKKEINNTDKAKIEAEKRKLEEEKKKIAEEKRKIAEAKKKEKKPKEKLFIIGTGTGFFVSSEGHVVTNDHVAGICKEMASTIKGKSNIFEIIATDKNNDLALLKGKLSGTKYLNINTEGAEFGDDIVAFGYPLAQDLSSSVKLTRGIVSSLSGPENNISQIQIDAAIQPGNSGGPVLNYEGQVVGVASAGLNKLYMLEKAEYIPENVNFAVAAPTLVSFLKANRVKINNRKVRVRNTKELAKVGMPATTQLLCLNTKVAYQELKKNKKYNDVLLEKVIDFK